MQIRRVATALALLFSLWLVPTSSDAKSLEVTAASLRGPNTNNPRGLIVGHRSVQSSAVAAVVRQNDLREIDRLDGAGTRLYEVPAGEDPAVVAARLRTQPGIAFAEPDYDVRPTFTNDSRIGEFWGLRNTGQSVGGRTGVSGVDVRVEQAWTTTKGAGVIVAVLDTGTEWQHSEFAGRVWTNDDCSVDGVDSDANGYIDDCHGWDFYNNDRTTFDVEQGDEHGTHVAGTIAAAIDSASGGAGVAPSATIMPLKFIGPNGGSISDAVEAIAYAKANGVKVINASWAGPSDSTALRNAIANSGAVFVAAAGNSSDDLTVTPTYPAAYDLPNLITVAAVGNRGDLASFSNHSGATDVGAPGVSILSTMPKDQADIASIDFTGPGNAYLSSFWGFGLEAVSGPTVRRELLKAQLTRLGAGALSSPITLVDDDESISGSTSTPDTNSYYLQALTDAGYTDVQVIEVAKDQSGPAEGTIHGRTVVWQTGYALGSSSTPTLTSTDQAQLKVFLDGGGDLLMAGADAIWKNEQTDFVRNYLGVTWKSEGDDRNSLDGVGSLFGMTLDISGVQSPRGTANPYEDKVEPTNVSAEPSTRYPASPSYDGAYGYLNGTSMAAPHVAGVAALAAAAWPAGDAIGITDVVTSTTWPLSSLSGKSRTGGMVDAGAAVAKARNLAEPPTDGYRFVASDGGIFSFGNADFYGSLGGAVLNQPIVGMASTPTGDGYWMVASDGGIFAFGDAKFFGSTGNIRLARPIVGMTATPDGNGYWLVASDGGIFAFGSARFFGSTGNLALAQPIVGMTATPDGNGYWMVASDGGIFGFGSARFFGSTGNISLARPIVSMASTPTGNGYWMVASDGGIFSYGDAKFFGSTGNLQLAQPVVSMAPTSTGNGYWLVASDGGVFSYGDAKFFGSTGNLRLVRPIVAVIH